MVRAVLFVLAVAALAAGAAAQGCPGTICNAYFANAMVRVDLLSRPASSAHPAGPQEAWQLLSAASAICSA